MPTDIFSLSDDLGPSRLTRVDESSIGLKAVSELARERVRKAKSYRRFSLFSSAPGGV